MANSTYNGYRASTKIGLGHSAGVSLGGTRNHKTSTMSNGLRTMSRDMLNRTTQSLNKSSVSNKSFKLPSYATCLQASIRPKTFQQLKFYLELAVKDKKVADMAYKTLSK